MSWPLVKLGDLFKVTSGGTPSRKKSEYYDGGDIHWVKTGDLHNKYVKSASEFITQSGLDGSSARLYPKGTVLVAMYGATIGACSILDVEAATNQACAAFTPNENVDSVFLYYLFKHNKPVFVKAGSGGAQPNISGTFLKNFEIPLPPLAEQKRIAAILDKADAIRQKRKQAIDLADEFLRSVFWDMFGDPVTNPKDWEKSSLTKFGDFKNGMNYGKGEAGQSLYSIGVGDFKSFDRILGTATLSKIELNEMPDKSYLLEDGDLLFVRSNGNKALVGRCLTVHPENEDVTYSGFCIRYRIDSKEQLDSDFVNYCMRIPSMKHAMLKEGQGANIQNINQKILSELMLPIPPIELQKQFASTVREFRLAQGRVIESSQSSTNLFDSLSQKAFTGEL
ncbi:restriction endonuclease subunit S [Vibrio splendidus]|uniref:restriction endonuclease subunit S n=1 Tax=Vibrio splendidus TaxID=29497 RepID=UPI0021B3E2EB|nr:restriction endonuclease subunit S [Vibrio splendidus]UWZ98812.1 restriction endonuclease subunit S [Vibrio splendidus]